MRTLVLSAFVTELLLFRLTQAVYVNSSIHQTGAWSACAGVNGVCIDTNSYSCSGSTITGKCPGGSNILCCPYPSGIKSSSCSGVCTRTANCPRSSEANKCPGPSYVQCCPASSPPSSSDEWRPCIGRKGVCINTTKYSCSTTVVIGACPGPASIRCCPYPGGVRTSKCNGACTRTENCPRGTLTGLCPGPSSVKCCPRSVTAPCTADVSSDSTCSLYKNIASRGNKVCTDNLRSFQVIGTIASTEAYLSNAFCACDETPKADAKAKIVRKCLQDRLLAASRAGVTSWTRTRVRTGLYSPHFTLNLQLCFKRD